jgi:hypothetical protein
MATYKITPATAKRAIGMIAHHNGDLPKAIHDLNIGLQSLGNMTDYKSEAVRDLLKWIHVRDQKYPATIQARRDQLAAIAGIDASAYAWGSEGPTQ